MRITIINQPFWPDVVATAQHMTDWTRHLTARGHTVTVIASRSVYGQPGAVLPKDENHDGVQIYRVGSNLFRKGHTLTRLVDFGLFHVRALFKALLLPRQDVVVCLTTPPFIGVVGMLIKWWRGARYVQYEMDVYPDVAIALGTLKEGGLATHLLERMHRRLLQSADRVVVLGRCMRRVVLSKHIPGMEKKLVLVTPWADAEEGVRRPADQNPFLKKHDLANKCVIMYAGNLGLGHDIQTLLGAIDRLRDDEGIRFVFVGGGRRMQEIQKIAGDKSYGHVRMLDYIPREELQEMLAAATIHIITQAPGTSGLIVPSKLYGILAAGRPSIYIGPADTEIACTLAENDAGIVLAPGDVAGLLAAIETYRQRPQNCVDAQTRTALAQGHTRDHCTAALTAMVEGLVGVQKSPSRLDPAA